MLVQIVDKQHRAANVVKTALVGVGVTGRAISVQVNSWLDEYGRRENYSVFVSAPAGENTEPFFETGSTLVEAVKKMVDSIKGDTKKNGTNSDESEIAPF